MSNKLVAYCSFWRFSVLAGFEPLDYKYTTFSISNEQKTNLFEFCRCEKMTN